MFEHPARLGLSPDGRVLLNVYAETLFSLFAFFARAYIVFLVLGSAHYKILKKSPLLRGLKSSLLGLSHHVVDTVIAGIVEHTTSFDGGKVILGF